MRFNIFSKIEEERSDFDNGGVWIVGKPSASERIRKTRQGERGGYYFSQREVLEAIDLASASKFRMGIRDEEGQRKTFMNIVNFYRDVMKMKINIDVSNYVFEPTSYDYTWPVWLMDRQFKQWASDESYDDQIDEFANDLASYGTTVSKRLKDCTERVPLRTMKNTQTAKTLFHSCSNGGYVHIDDDKHYNLMKNYPGWDISKLSKDKTYLVTERYGLVPKNLISTYKQKPIYESSDEDDMVLAIAIVILDEKSNGNNKSGRILFMETLDEESFPLEECHSDKVDGRWLGKGEIEKQLENQIARNLTANMRRRGLLWGTKKIYQSTDPDVQSNLVMEVKDGEVIKIADNGNITQVNTQNQQLGEYTSDEASWKENSQQISFAFEAATGETMPGGTPFSLGVILQKAVASHFDLNRKTFSNFLKRCFFDQIIPIFADDYTDEHVQTIGIGASDIDNLKESIATFHSNVRIFNGVLAGKNPNADAIKQQVMEEMHKNPYIFVKMPPDAYKNMEYYLKLNIDDDISAEMTSLTNLYQSFQKSGDPRANTVLQKIFAKQGKSLDSIAGPNVAPKMPTVTTPSPALPSPMPSVASNPVAS